MNERSERSDDLNVLPPTDASQTLAGVPRESAMLRATPAPLYETTPQGMVSAETSAERSCQVIVSGYELLEEIGRGGMGVVYRARNLGLMRDVAVKLLQERFPITGTAAERFLEEARITGQLQHPGIPPVHQVGRLDGGRPYLAMKLIKGRSLAELIEKKANLNVVGIFEQIAQTLGYAHANRVIHRDLKPANVMVGAFSEVQVMDWGLAKVLDRLDAAADDYDVKVVRMTGQGESDLETKAGSFLGTPAFMPPEQARGEFENVGPHSDVFGLGAILCMMLTGKPPFKGMDANSTRMLAGEGKLDEAHERLANCDADPELVALCRKCLAFRKEDRYATGSEVATAVAAMRAASEDRARQAEVDKAKAEVQAAEERKRQTVKQRLGLAVLASVILGGGIAFWQMREAITAKEKTVQALEERNLEQARLLAQRKTTTAALHSMTDDVIEKLFGKQPQLDSSEIAFLHNVIALYNQATNSDSESEESRNLRAEGRLRVGGLWRKLGKMDEAEKALVEARDQRQSLVDAQPENKEYRRELAMAKTLLAYVYEKTGRSPLAITEYRSACEIVHQLAQDFSKDAGIRVALAAAHNNLANLLRQQMQFGNTQQPAEVEIEYVSARNIRQALVNEFPDVADYRRDLAASHDSLAGFYRDMGQYARAEAEYNSARPHLETHPTSLTDESHRNALARLHNNLGNVYVITRRNDLAEKEFGAAIAILAKLSRDYPGLPNYRNELGQVRMHLANLFRDSNRSPIAILEYQAALDIQSKLLADYPKVLDYGVALANIQIELAMLHLKAKALPEASAHLAMAKPLVDKANTAEPANQYFRRTRHSFLLVSAEMALARNDSTAVTAMAAALVKNSPTSARTHVIAARLLARCSDATPEAATKAELAAAAVAYLKIAAEKGFTGVKELDADPHLKALQERDDYKQVIASMTGK